MLNLRLRGLVLLDHCPIVEGEVQGSSSRMRSRRGEGQGNGTPSEVWIFLRKMQIQPCLCKTGQVGASGEYLISQKDGCMERKERTVCSSMKVFSQAYINFEGNYQGQT